MHRLLYSSRVVGPPERIDLQMEAFSSNGSVLFDLPGDYAWQIVAARILINGAGHAANFTPVLQINNGGVAANFLLSFPTGNQATAGSIVNATWTPGAASSASAEFMIGACPAGILMPPVELGFLTSPLDPSVVFTFMNLSLLRWNLGSGIEWAMPVHDVGGETVPRARRRGC